MTRQEVIDLMKSSKSGEEWNANCDVVKRAFGGFYPSFWFEAIMMSGIAAKVCSQFKSAKSTTA